jgi:chaperonin GroEL
MNHIKGNGIFCAVQSPDYGDSRKEGMKDFAAITGATIIAKETGITLGTAGTNVLGDASKVRVTQWNTTIIDGKGSKEDINGRVATIEEQMKDANPNAEVKLKERKARLVNGMAVIYVGGNTDVEIREKKDRIDDALQATRAALEEGIIVGGGVAYVRAKVTIEEGAKPIGWDPVNNDQLHGCEILMKSIELPLMTIAENVGVSGDVVLEKVMKYKHEDSSNYGFNAKTLVYEDLLEAGVIDPTKVTRLALENAASVAGLLLTTRAVVNIKPQQ